MKMHRSIYAPKNPLWTLVFRAAHVLWICFSLLFFAISASLPYHGGGAYEIFIKAVFSLFFIFMAYPSVRKLKKNNPENTFGEIFHFLVIMTILLLFSVYLTTPSNSS
jgi:hypothetical protein